MDKKQPMTRRQRIRTIVRLGIIALIIVGLLALGSYLLSLFGLDNLTQEQIRQIIDGFGVWAPLAFVLITFLQVTFIPIPFVVSILAGNLLFGFWGAFFYSLIGSVAGSIFAYSLGKWIGRPFVNWAFGDEDVVNHYLMKTQGKEFVVFFFMFLLPFFPDDALCALAGITALNRQQFYFIQLVARPTTILGNLLLWTGRFVPYSLTGLIIIALLIIFAAVSFYFSFKYAEQLNRYFNRFIEFLSIKQHSAFNRALRTMRLHTSRRWKKLRSKLTRRLRPAFSWLGRVFAPLIRFVKRIRATLRAIGLQIKSYAKRKIEERLKLSYAKKAAKAAEAARAAQNAAEVAKSAADAARDALITDPTSDGQDTREPLHTNEDIHVG